MNNHALRTILVAMLAARGSRLAAARAAYDPAILASLDVAASEALASASASEAAILACEDYSDGEDFRKSVRIGMALLPWRKRRVHVYARIEYVAGTLTICGVVGPYLSGNCAGSCGQIGSDLPCYDWRYASGWDAATVREFAAIWYRWHVNNLHAGTALQMEYVRRARLALPVLLRNPYDWYGQSRDLLRAVDLYEDAGYVFGSAWIREDVPSTALDFLRALPDADRACPWASY